MINARRTPALLRQRLSPLALSGRLSPTVPRLRAVPASVFAALRERVDGGWLPQSVDLGGRRAPRPMAVPLASARALPVPMAVPLSDAVQAAPSRTSQMVALGFLALTAASLWRQDSVVAVTREALDGLRSQQVMALDIDAADRPAMDPRLAWILDPRARLPRPTAIKQRRVAVQPFEYEVREGETLQEIAARFGTDVGALLWNNGLDGPDQVTPGAKLTILPVRGVLHLVKPDETLASIAERYGSRIEDVMIANALDGSDRIRPGQVIIVAGGNVPMPTALTAPEAEAVAVPATGAAAGGNVGDAGAVADQPQERPEDLPAPTGAADWQRDFILSLAPNARESQRKTGVPASVTLAQAILESDWGRSRLTRDANNLFGIKAFGTPGSAGVYDINTWEVYGGENVTVMAGFKAYQTLADSVTDHGNWFHDNSRYADALAVKDDPRAFAYAINAAGYATDPAYAPKLIGLMDRFNLYAYDVPSEQ
jgi:flagellum-specific peptidoglycan hydrolase FlgJ